MISRRVRFSLLIVVAGTIMLLSLIPNPPRYLESVNDMDKISHGLAYLVLGFLLYLSLFRNPRKWMVYGIITLAGATVYGGVIELMQEFTGREGDLVDLLMDFSGALAGAFLAMGITAYLSRSA